MRIALPVFHSRISPVFDAARSLLTVDAEAAEETRRSEYRLCGLSLIERAKLLSDLGVEVLICGAITAPLLHMVRQHEIGVLPHIVGDIDKVIAAYLTGGLRAPRFAMPGCCGRRQRRRFRGGRTCTRTGEQNEDRHHLPWPRPER